jgi:drug/metabolite transporter (DMT)-like permease
VTLEAIREKLGRLAVEKRRRRWGLTGVALLAFAGYVLLLGSGPGKLQRDQMRAGQRVQTDPNEEKRQANFECLIGGVSLALGAACVIYYLAALER